MVCLSTSAFHKVNIDITTIHLSIRSLVHLCIYALKTGVTFSFHGQLAFMHLIIYEFPQSRSISDPIALYVSAFLDAGRCFSKMSLTVHAGTINNDLDITIASLGLENFEIGDQARKRSRLVHDWVKGEGNGQSYGFDLKVPEHHVKLLKSFKMNYDFAAAFQDNEIIFVDTRRFDDAAHNSDLRGHLGCHPDNMNIIVTSRTFQTYFPVLQKQVIEAVISGLQQLLIVMVCKSGRHRSVALMEFFHYCLHHTGLNVRAKYNCSEGRHWRRTCGGTCEYCCWHNDPHDTPARIKDVLVIALKLWKANLREWNLLPPEKEASPVSPPDRNVVCVCN